MNIFTPLLLPISELALCEKYYLPTWHADHAAFALHVRSLDLLVFGLRYTFLTSSSMYFRKGFSIESRYNSVSKPTSFVILLTWLVLYFYSLTSVYYKVVSITYVIHVRLLKPIVVCNISFTDNLDLFL